MLGKKYRYKGLDWEDGVQGDMVITNVTKNIPLRNQIRDVANFHGTYVSPTLASGRSFIFNAQLYGATKQQRGVAWRKLIDVIQPPYNPQDQQFFDLFRETDDEEEMVAPCKVFQMPQATNGLDDPIIEANFILYSLNEKAYSPTVKTVVGGIGTFAGTPLSTSLSTPLAGFGGIIEVENEGNQSAPLRIRIEGNVLNPKIFNLTNGQKYKIGNFANPYTINNFVYDNRNINNLPNETLVVTDNGLNIKDKRVQGGDIFLEPGINSLVVISDSYPDDAVVTITYRDTYILT